MGFFKAPPEKDLEWDDAGVEGQYRFIIRVWKLIHNYINTPMFTDKTQINKIIHINSLYIMPT